MEKTTVTPKPLAEVVASTLTSYTAQCWAWDTMPLFGSLVCASYDDITTFGVVTNIQTASSDTQRLPFPYQKTPAELRAEHPQIFEFLRTTFEVAVMGYQEKTAAVITAAIPPRPASIHAFIRPASPEEETHFFASPHFLTVLFGCHAGNPLLDETVISVLRGLMQKGSINATLFEDYYHTLTLLMGNDYRRLKILLQRLESASVSSLEKNLSL